MSQHLDNTSSCGRAAKKTKRYPSDVTDEEWEQIAPLIPKPGRRGRLLMVNLTPADISDSAEAQAILDGIRKRRLSVKHLFADGSYDRLKLMEKATYLDFVVKISADPTTRRAPKSCPPLGCRAHLRLDDAVAEARARLREAHRRLSCHDLVAMGNIIRRNAHP